MLRQPWEIKLAEALALAKLANEEFAKYSQIKKRMARLGQQALRMANSADSAWSSRSTSMKIPRHPKLSDLTPNQVAIGLGACDLEYVRDVQRLTLSRAWHRTKHKGWVMHRLQESGVLKPDQEAKYFACVDDAAYPNDALTKAFPWSKVAPAIVKIIDWRKAYLRPESHNGTDPDYWQKVFAKLKFDPD